MSIWSEIEDRSSGEISTKFNLGDEVWLVAKNKVVKTLVTKVTILWEGDTHEVKYSTLNEHDIPENRVFKTKNELLESL